MKKIVWMLTIVGILALGAHVTALAATPPFFKGKTVSIVVGYTAGGGYDTYARLVARHLGKYIPGKPTVIVQNMPGAGSLVAANYVYGAAPRDGTVLGVFGPAQILSQLVGGPGIQFDSEKFNWIGAANAGDVMVCVANTTAGVKTIDDAIKRKEPLVVGGTGAGTTTVNIPRAYKDILGANFKIITGYGGTAEMRAAMLTKELDAGCWQWSSVKVTAKSMLDQGTAVVFTQLGLQKAPELAGVQNALERAKTEEERTMLQGLLAENSLGRSFVASPAVPRERVQALTKAFMAALKDPKLQEEAKKMKLELDPKSGEECQKEVEMLKAAPPAILNKLKKILTEP